MSYIATSMAAHDVVQSPLSKNRGVAFGRRPPIDKSYIFDLDTKTIIKEFSSIKGHAFYGHGFWTSDNLIGTAEVDLETHSSCVVLRNGENPDDIITIINTNGFGIHSVQYLEASQSILVAHNGEWFNREGLNKANLTLINLVNGQQTNYLFDNLPGQFGLQHFVKDHNFVYCLFRIPPQIEHSEEWNKSPLIKLDLETGKTTEIQIKNREDLDAFSSDGLSLLVDDDTICATSQRGNSIYMWSKVTEELLLKKKMPSPSGVSKYENDFIFSSKNGDLFKLNSEVEMPLKFANRFYTTSHHQFFE